MEELSAHYKKAFLTGGRSGLGKAFLQLLLDEGVDVWVSSRDSAALPEHPRLHPVSLDLLDLDKTRLKIAQLLEEVPDFDLLINNAGYGVFAPLETFPAEHISGQLSVLLEGPILITQAFYQQMVMRGKGGAIVNISSLAGTFPIPLMSLYNAAKAGLSSFSRSIALEAKRYSVAVIDFQPGDFETDFNDSMIRHENTEDFQSKLWNRLEKNLQGGPSPESAAIALKRALGARRSQTVYTGGFFQAKLAPLLARFVPNRVLQACIRFYFGIR
jgi:short-subunit dehydrogenase